LTHLIKKLLYDLESVLLILAVIPVLVAMFIGLMLASLGDAITTLDGDVASWCFARMERLEDLKEELSN
jgi:type III secretory pathway component EscS